MGDIKWVWCVAGHGSDGTVPWHKGKSAGAFPGPTPADDVYAFGALMVEMGTGAPVKATLFFGTLLHISGLVYSNALLQMLEAGC